jgi:branched-chain amino acid transport system permease protein
MSSGKAAIAPRSGPGLAAAPRRHPAATLGIGSGATGLRASVLRCGVALAVLALPLLALGGSPYWVNVLSYTYLFAGLAAAWNIIGGFGGQFSLAHGVFFGIGAYCVALLDIDWGVSPWLGLWPGAVLAAAVAALVSWPTFRLRGPFFAIATMAVNEVAFVLANYFDGVTGGPRGLLVPFHAGLANMVFLEPWKYAALNFAFMALVLAVSLGLMRRRLGYYLLAVREDEDAARAAGIRVLAVKIQGMALSAALTAIGGGLFTMLIRVIDPPTLFSLQDVGVKFPLLALIGGLGTIWGPVIGALLVVPLENALRGALTGLWPGAHLVILGLIMILAARFMRRGIVGSVRALRRAGASGGR